MQYRSQFNILLYTYKALNNSAPVYLKELVCSYQPTRALRCEDWHLLKTPRIRTKTYSERRYGKAAATLRNSLPLHIQNVPSLKIKKTC